MRGKLPWKLFSERLQQERVVVVGWKVSNVKRGWGGVWFILLGTIDVRLKIVAGTQIKGRRHHDGLDTNRLIKFQEIKKKRKEEEKKEKRKKRTRQTSRSSLRRKEREKVRLLPVEGQTGPLASEPRGHPWPQSCVGSERWSSGGWEQNLWPPMMWAPLFHIWSIHMWSIGERNEKRREKWKNEKWKKTRKLARGLSQSKKITRSEPAGPKSRRGDWKRSDTGWSLRRLQPRCLQRVPRTTWRK